MPLAPGCRHALVAAVWVTKVTSVLCAASAAEASFRTLRRGLGLQRQPKSVAQSLRLRGGASDATRGDVAQEQGSDPEMSEGAVLGVEQLGWERAEAWKRLADGETPDEEFHDSDLLSSDELHKLVHEMVRPFLACRVCRACLCVRRVCKRAWSVWRDAVYHDVLRPLKMPSGLATIPANGMGVTAAAAWV